MIIISVILIGCHTIDPPHLAKKDKITCNPKTHKQHLGKPKSAINTMILPKHVRIIPHNHSVTMDFIAKRVNIKLNANDEIETIYCG